MRQRGSSALRRAALLTIPALVVLVVVVDVRDVRLWGFAGALGWGALAAELVALAAFAALVGLGRRVKGAAVALIAFAPVGFVLAGLGGGDLTSLDTITAFLVLSAAPLIAGLMLLGAHLLDGRQLMSEQTRRGLFYTLGSLCLLVGGAEALFDGDRTTAVAALVTGAVLIVAGRRRSRRGPASAEPGS